MNLTVVAAALAFLLLVILAPYYIDAAALTSVKHYQIVSGSSDRSQAFHARQSADQNYDEEEEENEELEQELQEYLSVVGSSSAGIDQADEEESEDDNEYADEN